MVLGADTRATEGPIVADKNCEKIHFMAPNIYCCGAGTAAANTEAVTGKKLSTERNQTISLYSFVHLSHKHHNVCSTALTPDMVSSQLQLHRAIGRESRVVTALKY